MRFLVDECLSVRLAALLTAAGHDAVHVVDCDLAGCPDEQVLARAVDDGRVLLSADTDFGEILARSRGEAPSVILYRRNDRRPTALLGILSANLDAVAEDLKQGAFVVMTEDRIRIRRLPLR
jgi:predicted nuclease of predicted toxin-antitoxin system